MSTEVLIYSSRYCPFCLRAEALLQKKGCRYTRLSVDGDAELRREMSAKAGATSVPQIWIGERHIGGCDQLYALERSGELDPLLVDVAKSNQ